MIHFNGVHLINISFDYPTIDGSFNFHWVDSKRLERLEMARKRIVGEAPLTDRIVTTPENLLLLPVKVRCLRNKQGMKMSSRSTGIKGDGN